MDESGPSRRRAKRATARSRRDPAAKRRPRASDVAKGIDFSRLDLLSLRKYRKHFGLKNVSPDAPKDQLAAAVEHHFYTRPTQQSEYQIIATFIETVRRKSSMQHQVFAQLEQQQLELLQREHLAEQIRLQHQREQEMADAAAPSSQAAASAPAAAPAPPAAAAAAADQPAAEWTQHQQQHQQSAA